MPCAADEVPTCGLCGALCVQPALVVSMGLYCSSSVAELHSDRLIILRVQTAAMMHEHHDVRTGLHGACGETTGIEESKYNRELLDYWDVGSAVCR